MSQTDIVLELLRSAHTTGKRSSALNTPIWGLSVALAAFAGAAATGAQVAVLVLLGVVVAAFTGLILYLTVLFAKSDPDRLHTETFLLKREEIRRGSIGDVNSGTIAPVEPFAPQPLLVQDGAIEPLPAVTDKGEGGGDHA